MSNVCERRDIESARRVNWLQAPTKLSAVIYTEKLPQALNFTTPHLNLRVNHRKAEVYFDQTLVVGCKASEMPLR